MLTARVSIGAKCSQKGKKKPVCLKRDSQRKTRNVGAFQKKKNNNSQNNEYLNVLFGHLLRFGLWTPKAVMKTLTTTIIKTRPVVRFSMRFSFWCFCTSLRFHRTVEQNKELNPTSHKHTQTLQWRSQTSASSLWEPSQSINHRFTVESTVSQFILNSQSTELV